MEEAARAAAAAATAHMQVDTYEEVLVASGAEVQAETDEDEPASDGETEASGEEDAEWQTVGKFQDCGEGGHVPEANEEEEEEEGPGASQVDEMIEEENVAGSATPSTNKVVLDQDEMEDAQSTTSTGIFEGEEEEIEVALATDSTDQLTTEAKRVITLSQLDPTIINATLPPTKTLFEPMHESSQNTEGPQSPASVQEQAVPVEMPNTSTYEIWPALPAIETWNDFIARKPEVWSAEQVAAAAAVSKPSPISPPGILSYATAAAVPASPSIPVKSSSSQGVNIVTASAPSTLSPKESRAASSSPKGTGSTALPLQEVFNKKTDEVSEVSEQSVEDSQAVPKKTFVRHAAGRREAERVAQEAAAAAAAAQASPQDADTESIVTKTSQAISVPKKKRR